MQFIAKLIPSGFFLGRFSFSLSFDRRRVIPSAVAFISLSAVVFGCWLAGAAGAAGASASAVSVFPAVGCCYNNFCY